MSADLQSFMGVTVHYEFKLPLTVSAGDVRARLARWREFAAGLAAGRVTPIAEVCRDDICATQAIFRRDSEKQMEWHYPIQVTQGWKFVLRPKARCEPLCISLCRYPEWIDIDGQQIHTRFGGAWRYRFQCRTQQTNHANWDVFLGGHRTVIECLAQGREYGVQVRIRDEGGYWPRRDERTLRRRLTEMSGRQVGSTPFKVATLDLEPIEVSDEASLDPEFEQNSRESR